MRKLLLAALACAALVGSAQAQFVPSNQPPAPINISTATTTQIIAAPTAVSYSIVLSHYFLFSAGADQVTFVYGTGTNCGTGTTSLGGVFSLLSQTGFAIGNGSGIVLSVPTGNALCLTTSAPVQLSGFMMFTYQ